jgi:hypothetical protein
MKTRFVEENALIEKPIEIRIEGVLLHLKSSIILLCVVIIF